jgi:hypothetical protein
VPTKTHAIVFDDLFATDLSKMGYFPALREVSTRGWHGETAAKYQHRESCLYLIVDFNPTDKCATIRYGRIWSWPGTGYVRLSGSYRKFMEYFGYTGFPESFKISYRPNPLELEEIYLKLAETLPILQEKLDEQSLSQIENIGPGGSGALALRLEFGYPDIKPTVTPYTGKWVR